MLGDYRTERKTGTEPELKWPQKGTKRHENPFVKIPRSLRICWAIAVQRPQRKSKIMGAKSCRKNGMQRLQKKFAKMRNFDR
jgi:hypothetical protein